VGLNLSGLFEVSFGLENWGSGLLTGKSGKTASFLTGLLAVAIATPCTAPFMATAIGFALTRSSGVALTVFWALGLGLALPYLAICLFPVLRKKLPKPGIWMQTFRELLAFPLYLSVLWLIWVYLRQTSPLNAILLIGGMVVLVFTIWLGKKIKTRRWIPLLLLVGIASIPVWQTTEKEQPGTESFSREKLETLLKNRHPVFVDATADWCLTCKVNERLTLNTEKVTTAFRKNQVTVLKADWTLKNPEVTAWLESFGRSGVPLYVYYAPDAEPVVLPQILSPESLLEKINLPLK
jgi:thiol:disulfide interchange protein DsbD